MQLTITLSEIVDGKGYECSKIIKNKDMYSIKEIRVIEALIKELEREMDEKVGL